MAKMKLWTSGRWLWTRTVGSTLCGELVDSVLFYTLAFYGSGTTRSSMAVTLTQYVFKSGWEIIMTPVTYRVVGFPQARRAGGLFRPRHQLHAVLAQDLIAGPQLSDWGVSGLAPAANSRSTSMASNE